jgi:hypothetical protein
MYQEFVHIVDMCEFVAIQAARLQSTDTAHPNSEFKATKNVNYLLYNNLLTV